MIRHDVVVVGELFVADGAFLVLIDDLPVQQFPHLRRGPELPISSRVMRIFDPLHPKPHCPGFGDEFPATAGNRFVYGTEFIATKPHNISFLLDSLKSIVGVGRSGRRGIQRGSVGALACGVHRKLLIVKGYICPASYGLAAL